MIETDGPKIFKFFMLYVAGKRNFQCELKCLQTLKQAHLRINNIFPMRNTSSKQ